jgi:Diacylglycerol kinase catalytic domain
VVAVGGDGMASAIAASVARAKLEGDGVFAMIPAWRGNDLARTYRIPFNARDASKLLLAGQSLKLRQVSNGCATNLIVGCNRSMSVGIDGESLPARYSCNTKCTKGDDLVMKLRSLPGFIGSSVKGPRVISQIQRK